MSAGPDAELRLWYISELSRLGFSRRQRDFLIPRIEAGEIEFAEFRKLVEERGWTVEQEMFAVV